MELLDLTPTYQSDLYDDLQSAVWRLVLPATTLAGMTWLVSMGPEEWNFHNSLLIFLIISIPIISGIIYLYFENIGLLSLILGISLIITLLNYRYPDFETFNLFLIPVGLSILSLERKISFIISLIISIIVILVNNNLYSIIHSLLMIWATYAFIWLALKCADHAIGWALHSAAAMRSALEVARDQRVELKETQQDLVHSNEELLRISSRLGAMRQVAEDARRVKEEFVANVSHELRTPLNMIIGFSEMIMDEPQVYGEGISPSLLSDLNIVLKNSRHLSSLIDDILDLSQIEAGRWALAKERVPISEIVEAATKVVLPLFRSKGLYLVTDVLPGLPPVFCDRTRVRQVLVNLLSNAGRFTEEGGVSIKVWKNGGQIVAEVVDTGPGIPLEQQDRLFQPFEQLQASLFRHVGGSGLGLAISKAFVELHGGEMWLESEPGRGTTFSFSLPISPPATIEGGVARWFSPYQQHETRIRRPALPHLPPASRYVVLEDGQMLQGLLRRYMDAPEIVPVSTVEEARRELQKTPARALLVNAAYHSKALEQFGRLGSLPYGTPAIICSVPDGVRAANTPGITGYLVKPILRGDLVTALDRLHLENGTVLIVDDEPDALRLYHRILVSCPRHYRVLRASDGRQALQILREEHPDVMLLDLVMPNMDGFDLLQTMQAEPAAFDLPVIVISAHDPSGQPIVSNTISLVSSAGLSIAQVLGCIDTLSTISSPPEQ